MSCCRPTSCLETVAAGRGFLGDVLTFVFSALQYTLDFEGGRMISTPCTTTRILNESDVLNKGLA